MWVKDDVQVSDMNHGLGPVIPYSSILAYKISCAKEPGGLRSMGATKSQTLLSNSAQLTQIGWSGKRN